jgi:hypothetical protein
VTGTRTGQTREASPDILMKRRDLPDEFQCSYPALVRDKSLPVLCRIQGLNMVSQDVDLLAVMVSIPTEHLKIVKS